MLVWKSGDTVYVHIAKFHYYSRWLPYFNLREERLLIGIACFVILYFSVVYELFIDAYCLGQGLILASVLRSATSLYYGSWSYQMPSSSCTFNGLISLSLNDTTPAYLKSDLGWGEQYRLAAFMLIISGICVHIGSAQLWNFHVGLLKPIV